MLLLAQNVNDTNDLCKWIRGGLNGINNYCTAFAIINQNREHVLFSVCRKAIQFKYVYDELEAYRES